MHNVTLCDNMSLHNNRPIYSYIAL